MLIRSVDLPYVCGVKSVLPKTGKPEFVLAGRSNVGKSSFVNALIQRKSFARTSSTPGKTRTINFYAVNDAFFLVDLPGYGYAKTGPVEQEKWDRLIRRYLSEGEDIEEVILLLDSRRVPNEMDLQMFQWILAATGYEPIVIITKMDKLKRSQHAKAIKEIREKLGASKDCMMIPFSAETKSGREEFLELVDKILRENS
ncbi:MAG: YihA family ribosome biogenesis GTP-binding protein [Oribacterium parvum]|jgi:ribosome biogenesis GTP-binding protein ysxC|uniref:ribosome biogenesis GTP-binding protein YihA/YsxC n=1 Tax=Oribacterium parvum TaxID=1501329 RepID=UPI001CAFDEC7|nr:ribosome biogenesis GTP-binding protein YihA/YsxC [Oribacterium parvum]MBF1268836.1 YihA family ribosome biogenesis GTP-binding protein [Oribacterium parvum]